MSDGTVQIAELDDVEEKVYAIGVNLEAYTEEEVEELMELLDSRFVSAGWMVVGLPIEGSVEISELDPDEVEEILGHDIPPEVYDG